MTDRECLGAFPTRRGARLASHEAQKGPDMTHQRTTTHALVAAILGVSAMACHHSQPAPVATLPAEPTTTETQPHAAQGQCPMQVPGTQVAVNDTKEGVVVVFTTPRENLAQLRERVRDLASKNEQALGPDQGLDGNPPMSAPVLPDDKTGPIEPTQQESGGTIGGKPLGAPAGGIDNPSAPPNAGMPSATSSAMVPASIRVEDFDDGSQIVITPKDPAQLDSLREQIRQRVSQMSGSYCPLMV